MKLTREDGVELLKTIGYDNNSITSTEIFIAQELGEQIKELEELLKRAETELKEELAECGHDPSVGIDASKLIYLIEDIKQALKK